MNKENSRGASSLRRSAVVERLRIREEWSILKGTNNVPVPTKKAIQKKTIKKPNAKATVKRQIDLKNDVLRGVVVLVDVGAESRALALRAALAALGATVVPTWNPLVTHLVWSEGGCRTTRAKARLLATRLVSPLWVEACAASNRRLPEVTFPAAARASDLPSPRTLRRLLKQAEAENIPLIDLLDSSEEKGPKNRLRISSETEQDTTADTSRDTSRDTTATDVESRVNTAPRRALPVSITPPVPKKSRRKLFTQREAHEKTSSDSENEPAAPKRVRSKLTQQERRELARAERMAKRIVASCTPAPPKKNLLVDATLKPKIVLTGMTRSERSAVSLAVLSLKGRICSKVNKKTTHILVGSCREDPGVNTSHCSDIPSTRIPSCDIRKARTANALMGAARGCRVLYGQWAIDSMQAKKWLHHLGYEVMHLLKLSQKARVERKALECMRSEYAYDVFNGTRVQLSSTVTQRDAVVQVLNLCGAVVIDQDGRLTENGALTQNGGCESADSDVRLGSGAGEVGSKWVFDSVCSTRMRSKKRYINNAF